MTVLLDTDDVVLVLPSADTDDHGWRLPGTDPYWEGRGALQLRAGVSDPRASEGGGRGPSGPARDEVGDLYLPTGLRPLEGSTAEIRGRVYVLSQVRLVVDPVGLNLDCWAATATSVDTWPDGGAAR